MNKVLTILHEAGMQLFTFYLKSSFFYYDIRINGNQRGIKMEILTGADLISKFRVRGVRQNSHLKQAKMGTLEYSGVDQAITVWIVKNNTI